MKKLATLLFLTACNRGPTEAPAPADRPVPQRDVITERAPVVPPPTAERALRVPVRGAAADPPLRALDPTMEVPRWQGEGELGLQLPASGEGPVRGSLRAGDLSLRVRGFVTGETLRATLEPEAIDADAAVPVWRGLLECTLRAGTLTGTWSLSAEGGRLARAGTVGPPR